MVRKVWEVTMKRIEIETLPDHEERMMRLTKQVMNNEHIKEFIATHKMSEEDVHHNLARFYEYLNPRMGNLIPVLVHNGHFVEVHYRPSLEVAARLKDGISRYYIKDASTRLPSDVLLSDLTSDKDNLLVIKAFQRMVENYQYKGDTKGVWLCGKFGVGKTYIMNAVMNELYKKGASVVFVSTSELLSDLKKMIDDNQSISTRINLLKQAEILALDDIGAESTKEWGYKTVLYDILNERAINNRPTFFTSNLTQDGFVKQVAQRIGDNLDAGRFLERVQVLSKQTFLGGENRRVKA